MTRVVFDAGALIAVERGDRRIWGVIKSAVAERAPVLVPATALAQVWRGRASQALLARAMSDCVIASFDDVALEVGQLCGRAGTRDICDAHVALVAARRGEVLYTSDPRDLERLLRALGRRDLGIVRC